MAIFLGKVEPLAKVNVSVLSNWIAEIPFEAWPQQNKPGESLRPAMMTDLAWFGFGNKVSSLVSGLMSEYFLGLIAKQWMLSVVMPGDSIPPHRDLQRPEWEVRVHVPLLTNDQSVFMCGGESFGMVVGHAYKVNTLAEHSVSNEGPTPRIHFMFDVQWR